MGECSEVDTFTIFFYGLSGDLIILIAGTVWLVLSWGYDIAELFFFFGLNAVERDIIYTVYIWMC